MYIDMPMLDPYAIYFSFFLLCTGDQAQLRKFLQLRSSQVGRRAQRSLSQRRGMNNEVLFQQTLSLLLMRSLIVFSRGMGTILLSLRRYLLPKLWQVTQHSWQPWMGEVSQSLSIPLSAPPMKKWLKGKGCLSPRNLPKRETWESSSTLSSLPSLPRSRKLV